MRRILVVLLALVVTLSFVTPVAAGNPIRIFYAGPEKNSVHTALTLAPKGTFSFVTDSSLADVFVLNGTIPDPAVVAARVDAGAGILLILGPDLTAETVQTALGIPLTLEPRSDAISLTNMRFKDPLVSEIIWNGAPQVRERSNIETPISSVQPLVSAYEDGGWVLWSAHGGRAFIFNAFLTDGFNPQIQDWAYFNYLIYHLAVRLAGQTPFSFADYPVSPVPHAPERNILLGVMGLILVTTFAAFYVVRRYSLGHPEELNKIVSNRAMFQVHEESTEWENVGFHRPLSGFLVALSIGLVLFIPLIIYQNLILPSYI